MRNPGRHAKSLPLNAWPESEAGLEPWPSEVVNGKPVYTLEQILVQLTRFDTAWTGIGPNPTPIAGAGTITYGFFDFASQVYSSESSQFQPLSQAQRAAAREAFAIWGDYIAVSFVEGPVTGADINLGNIVSSEDFYSAYATHPGPTLIAGDIWLRAGAPANQEIGLAQPGFRTLLHEMGHALGLSHPGNYDASPNAVPTYEANAEYYQDSLQYTIMSYFGSSSTGAVRTSYAATPMVHDIAAAQSLYGANMATRTGDTVYGFHSNAGRDAFDFTLNTQPVIGIWDAGGRDTLDFSGWSTASKIDLAPGGLSDGGGQTTNVQIAFGAVIENAIGGGGDDLLLGNNAGNVLSGGGGNDQLTGGGGGDRQEGGAGADIFVFTAAGHSMDAAFRSDGKKLLPDVLADFTSGSDRIDLSAIDAVAGTAGDEAFAFIGAAAFTGQAGQLRYEVIESFLHIYGDVNGDGLADFHIAASGTELLAGDFLL